MINDGKHMTTMRLVCVTFMCAIGEFLASIVLRSLGKAFQCL